MFKWIKRLIEDFRFYQYCEAMDDSAPSGYRERYELVPFDRFLQEWLQAHVTELECNLLEGGHDWQVEGWATPDTGGESWECSRCHKSGHVTYY